MAAGLTVLVLAALAGVAVAPALAGLQAAGLRLPTPVSALRHLGRTRDGWERYRLAAGRLPDRLSTGSGWRAQVSWLQGGRVRLARIDIPSRTRSTAPLLVALPGLDMSLSASATQQHWEQLALQQHVVLVEAAGWHGAWKAGSCCGAAARQRIDDLGYLDRVKQIAAALHGAADPSCRSTARPTATT